MDQPTRIAVVGPVHEHLAGDLRRLPLRPEVRACRGLTVDTEALLRFQPDVLLLAFDDEPSEEVGALRVLRQLWPGVAVVVVVAPEHEVAIAPLARQLHALVLVYPDTPGQLAAVLEQARHGGDRPRAESFVDLARGVADEINNPLMFVSGHLQLLRSNLQAPERDRRDQADAALAGVTRIAAAIERLRLLATAADGPRHRGEVDLAAVLAARLAAAPRRDGTAAVAVGDGPHTVPGDAEHLAALVQGLLQFADELAAAGATAELRLETAGAARRLRVTAAGSVVQAWQLPHSFEPYYPARALRGQSAGLGLFLAQTVTLGHRGQATARRTAEGALQLDFVLPA